MGAAFVVQKEIKILIGAKICNAIENPLFKNQKMDQELQCLRNNNWK